MARNRHANQSSGQERLISKVLRKYHLSDGDVLLIKAGSALANPDALNALGKEFEKLYKFRILFIVVNDLEDIQKADPKAMRDAGWIYWPKLAGRVKPKAQEQPQESEKTDDGN